MKPIFSVVMPAFNGLSVLGLVLRCLEAQTFSRERFECIVVDDGSTDGTAEFLQSRETSINLRCFAHPANRGRAQARNTACEQAEGDFLVFLDADVLAEPDWLAHYYQALVQNPTWDVISGGRYYVHLGSNAGDRPRVLGQMLGAPSEELFLDQVAEQFEHLRAHALSGGYPGYAMAKIEAQLPEICQRYPESLLCAYAVITANVAVRRSAFEKVGGFDISMRRTEDTDLGVRLWEIGARFGCAPDARAYHMYHTSQGDRNNTLVERQSFFYRHPYQLIILLHLWFTFHENPNPNPPSPIFESLLTLLAVGDKLAEIDAGRELAQIYRQSSAWADCVCDQDLMAAYYCEHSGISRQQINAYLEQAVARGIVTHRRAGRYYFDFDHTTNWLRKCTPYQQHELERTRYHWIRNWIPNLQGNAPEAGKRDGTLNRPSLSLQCRGVYEINIPAEALAGVVLEGSLSFPLPIEHPCQTDVKIVSCEPATLLNYANAARSIVSGFPLEHGLDRNGGLTLRYEFECNLHEYLISEHGLQSTPRSSSYFSRSSAENGLTDGGSAQYLKPTYPATSLPQAEALLKKIFAGPARDSHAVARAIYLWILNNRRYLQSFLADYLILETGFGPCVQMARLFVNLCRLMRVPAREQCGALFGRAISPDDPQRTVVTGRSYNILTHTWAEFYSPRYGWVPVEFAAADFGRHLLTALNVEDESLRGQMIRETDLYSGYYFGNMDPFRIYSGEQVSQPTYPLIKSKLPPEALKMLMLQTRHRLVCDVSGTAQFGDLWASLESVRETSHSQTPTRAPAEVRRVVQRMVITSIGSTGDVQPLLGLAHDLRCHGHTVIFALPSMYRERVQKLGFPFVEIGAGTGVDAWHEIFARQAEITDPVEQTRYFVETLAPWMPQMHSELCALSAHADVLISPAFQSAARMTHDTTGIPFVSVHFSPFGSSGSKAVREASAPVINRVRQGLGLSALEDPLGADAASPQLALYAVSQHVFRKPAGWPARAHLTGYWYFDEESWQPTPELVNFIEAGAPPVVISFGSMPSEDPEALTDLILKGIEQAQCRAIIQRGGGGLARHASLPQNIYAADFVPHAWLFPHASCIVHHGGAGTSAAAFRAGVPTVVVPHLLDQPIWAEYARAFGCAGAVIPHAQLSAEKLAAALTRTLSTPRFAHAAAQMGEKIRAENGVQTARMLIESIERQS